MMPRIMQSVSLRFETNMLLMSIPAHCALPLRLAHLHWVSSGRPACCSCQRARHLPCALRGQRHGASSGPCASSWLSSRQIQHTSSPSCSRGM
jgi:hypothetical protein